MVASDYQTNKRSGKKRKKVLEEYQKEKISFMYKYLFLLLAQARNSRGGGGEVSHALFWKLEKSTLIWRKNALFVVIFR